MTTGYYEPRHAGGVKTKGRDNKRRWGPYQRGVDNQTENPSGCSTRTVETSRTRWTAGSRDEAADKQSEGV